MDKKLKRLGIYVVLILLVVIAGKMYMSHKEAERQRDLHAVEKQSVKVLKHTFTDIKEIKVDKSAKNNMTGSYLMFITMTNQSGKSVYFDYSFWKEANELGTYGVVDETVQKEGVTSHKIKVIYSNGTKEEM